MSRPLRKMRGLACGVVANRLPRQIDIARPWRDVVNRLQHRETARRARRISAKEQGLVRYRGHGDRENSRISGVDLRWCGQPGGLRRYRPARGRDEVPHVEELP